MTAIIEIDDFYPRPDRVAEVAGILRRGGLVAMPTDTTWIVACNAFDTAAATRLRTIRARMAGESTKGDDRKPMSLMCPDLAAIGTFALVDQPQFRMLKRLLPGPYTVILPASRQVPRQLQSKRRAIGVRMPDHPVALAVLEAVAEPLFVTTCHDPDGRLLGAAPEVEAAVGSDLGALIETTPIQPESSTVVDWTGAGPVLIRAGKGPAEPEWDDVGAR